MKVQFEITTDTVETGTQISVALSADEIEDFGEELGRVIERYFQEQPFATYDINRVSLVNVEVRSSKFGTLEL